MGPGRPPWWWSAAMDLPRRCSAGAFETRPRQLITRTTRAISWEPQQRIETGAGPGLGREDLKPKLSGSERAAEPRDGAGSTRAGSRGRRASDVLPGGVSA